MFNLHIFAYFWHGYRHIICSVGWGRNYGLCGQWIDYSGVQFAIQMCGKDERWAVVFVSSNRERLADLARREAKETRVNLWVNVWSLTLFYLFCIFVCCLSVYPSVCIDSLIVVALFLSLPLTLFVLCWAIKFRLINTSEVTLFENQRQTNGAHKLLFIVGVWVDVLENPPQPMKYLCSAALNSLIR